MAMAFTHLRTFHAVADTGGFTSAAAVLGIGQPTVTTQVKEMEHHYGVELFLRRGRKVELTDTGEALLPITRRLVGIMEEADELLTSHGDFRIGNLKLAAVGPFHATEMIAAFKRAYPAVQLNVLLGNSWQTLSNLIDLRADVAILAHIVDDERVETIPYSTHEVVVFVNRSHPWFGRKKIRLEELARQPFVLRERGSTTRLAFENAIAEADILIDPVLEIGSREGVWKAVEQGIGISVVADFEFVAHPNLHAIGIEDVRINTEYRIAHLKERRHSPKIRAFIDALKLDA